jgi:arylsulfatase A-like enzyme
VPVHRLADERAAALGHEAPVVTLANQMRYVLSAPASGVLRAPGAEVPAVPVGPDGVATLALECPAELAGAEVLLTVNLARGVWREGAVCPRARDTPMALPIARLRPGDEVRPVVLYEGMPRGAAKTRALALRPAAMLRTALGVAAGSAPAVRFRVFAKRRGRAATAVFDRTVPAEVARAWQEVVVPLRDLAGSGAVRLAFHAASAGSHVWPAMPVWGDPTIFDVASGAPERPNVILISLDTLRADRLGCYGAERPTSPALDRLAAEGTLFETAITAAPWTLPSHLTMLTGAYPCVHQLVTRAIVRRPTAGLPSLAQRLREAGYVSAAFTEDGYLLPGVFQPGFDVFSYAAASPDGIAQRVREAGEWLERTGDTPFFLFLHTYQVHAPYQAPAPWARMFRSAGTNGDAAGLDDYDAALRYADATLASLRAIVERLGLAERTITIVTSDHGEGFGEHGIRLHGNSLYEEVLQVPFIWHAPGRIATGRRVAGVVSLADLAPTVLDLLALPPAQIVQGRSLAPLMRPDGGADDAGAERLVYSENLQSDDTLVVRGPGWKAAFDARGRLRRIHALRDDPEERDAASGDAFRAAAAAARAGFTAECERLRALLPRPAAPVAPEPPDPEQERRLRALGYVE